MTPTPEQKARWEQIRESVEKHQGKAYIGSGVGIFAHLHELIEADPFVRFRIDLGDNRHLWIDKPEYIVFTKFGVPKVFDNYDKNWILVNVEAITEILLQ